MASHPPLGTGIFSSRFYLYPGRPCLSDDRDLSRNCVALEVAIDASHWRLTLLCTDSP